jgi:hypothetical protein
MLRKEDLAVIKALKQCGVYQKDIAAQLGVHPNMATATSPSWRISDGHHHFLSRPSP